jgi:hypothetical protein
VYSAVIAALVGLALLSLLLRGRARNETFGPALPEIRLVPHTDTGDRRIPTPSAASISSPDRKNGESDE